MQNWSYSVGNMDAPVTTTQGGNPSLTFRNPLDAARAAMSEKAPTAQYPDGYLDTINSRRENRLLDALHNRNNDRSYQRGVHKGERIDPTDYFWPSDLSPNRGLRREAAAISSGGVTRVPRNAPLMTVFEQLEAHRDKLPRGADQALRSMPGAPLDPDKLASLQRFRPGWV